MLNSVFELFQPSVLKAPLTPYTSLPELVSELVLALSSAALLAMALMSPA